MSADNVQVSTNWWAEGDTPVHSDSRMAYLIDAHSTFLIMLRGLVNPTEKRGTVLHSQSHCLSLVL